MGDLSTLVPVRKANFVPGTFESRLSRTADSVTRYSREWPHGRVHLAGGGPKIAPYGRSYPLPEALTELKKAGLNPGRSTRRVEIRSLRGNPNGDLKTWIMDRWKWIAGGVGAIVVLSLISR